MTAAPSITAALPERPYPGLRPFDDNEWAIFFGRERMIDDMIGRLAGSRLVLIHGVSGSGKSSLVRAGVLPKLALQYSRHAAPWLTCSLRPSGGPLWNLAAEFARLEGHDGDLERISAIAGRFNARSATLASVAASLERIEDKSLCILVDQFEELFRYERETSRDEAELFIDLLERAAREDVGDAGRDAVDLHVIITMRSEFLGECSRFAGFAETINRTQYLVPRMDDDGLIRAVRRPAQMYGGEFGEELAERLIASVRGREDELPLLQHGLMLMWEDAKRRAPGRRATLDGQIVGEAGGLAELLSSHADAVMASIAPDERRERMVEAVFRALTDVNSEGSAIRRPVPFSELCAVTGATPEELRPIVDAFRTSGVSFLTPYALKPIKDNTPIDISHEALIRCWSKIGDKPDGWLQKEIREGLGWRALLFQAENFLSDRTNVLSAPATDLGEKRLKERNEAWADRYGGGWPKVEELVDASREHWKIEAEKVEVEQRKALASFSELQIMQSRFLAAQARQQRGRGDAGAAVLLALEALPDRAAEVDRPYVPEAELELEGAFCDLRERLVLGHDDAVASAMFSPDGQHIVTASDDKTARVWDAATGKETGEALRDHEDAVQSAAFSPDGTRVVTASWDKTARIWDAATGKPIGEPLGHEGAVNNAAFSPDGKRIVTASDDKTARIWDAATGKPIGGSLKGHDGSVWSAAFSPDGRRIVTASWDKTARIWDAETSNPIGKPLKGHSGPVWSVAFSPDGNRVITAGDWTVRVRHGATGKLIRKPLKGHDGAVYSATFSPDGKRIVTASNDKTARVWDAASGQPIGEPLTGHDDKVWSAAFSPDGQRIVTASQDKTARVWGAANGKPTAEPLKIHIGAVNNAAFSRDGRRIVTALYDKTARVWDAVTGQPIGEALKGHTGRVCNAAFSPDGTRIVTGSADKTARVWDAATGQPIGEQIKGHEDVVRSAAFSPDGTRIVTASADKTARTWDAATGRPIGAPLIGHQGPVNSAAFSPEGTRIVTASDDNMVRIWDAATGQPIGEPLKRHDGGVYSPMFSPDGQRIVTASYDETACIWDAATGQPIGEPLKGHGGAVWSAAFSPDGQRIVTASWDKTARVWDAASGKPIDEPLKGHDGAVLMAVFSPDGMRILTASRDTTARVWDVFPDTQSLVSAAKAAVPRCLTPAQRKAFFLPPEPPEWCIEMEKWPYNTPEWKQWLADTRAGKSPPLPAAP